MLRQIDRPFDYLDSLKGKRVMVTCKAYKEHIIEGILHAFDIHTNLVVETNNQLKKSIVTFVKGENVLFVEGAE